MARTGDNLPTGFLGPAKGWGSLVPDAARVLRLPQPATREVVGQGPFELIELRALTESMGRVEDALRQLAGNLVDGGTLLCDIDNVQSARMLRMVVEGRPGQFDPAGSSQDPSQALPLRRVLLAAAAAGLCVRDVLRVPSGAAEFPPSMVRDLFASGIMPVDWLDGAPPSRFWLQCEKVTTLAGSVLLAGDDVAARERTVEALRSYLPADWEIVFVDAVGECAQWNRAVAQARGDVVWFVRAGMTPDEETFAALSVHAGVGPAIAAPNGVPAAQGDIAGTMLPRLDVLLVGPLPERFENSRVALEDYVMRVDSKLPAPIPVDVALDVPPPPVERPERFAVETQDMVARWAPVEDAIASSAANPSTTAVAEVASPAPWQGRKPRISLCMIARNEERFLDGCLQRAKDAFDELILVDTGSTDRTVAIAESYGAKVLYQNWQDDFSKPRNLGLEAATGDWILVLDADEFLQPGACERIRELVEDPKTLGVHMRFVNDYGNGKTIGVMMVRLFRNLPGIHYQNIIHEQVTPSLQAIGEPKGLILRGSEIEVVHHGYSDEVMTSRDKTARNERLFQRQLQDTPDDIYNHYKYGDFLRRVPGRSADARRLLDRCFDLILAASPTLPRSLPYAGEVAALCALEAERAGDGARAREVVDVALRRFVPTPNLHYLAASLALVDGRSETAIHHYRRCLAYRGQVLVVPIQEGITSYVSLVGIAQAWLQRGDQVRARRLMEQAIAIAPDYEVAYLALSRLWLEAGDVARALSTLTSYLDEHPESPGACQQTMLILHRLGRTDAARQMGRHTVRLLEARALDHEAAAVNEILARL
ncbi:MAG: glycosyltransferase [Planctomycetota bacterium]